MAGRIQPKRVAGLVRKTQQSRKTVCSLDRYAMSSSGAFSLPRCLLDHCNGVFDEGHTWDKVQNCVQVPTGEGQEIIAKGTFTVRLGIVGKKNP